MAKQLTDYWQNQDNPLQFIMEKVDHLEKMTLRLAVYLPPNLAKSCRVAQTKDNKLIIMVKDGNIATQLRYQTAELLDKLRHDHLFRHIKTIECKVSPYLAQSMPISKCPFEKVPLLSKETAKILLDTAESLSDPALKAIMERIARNHQ